MAAPQAGWWWNPAEPGRGFFLEVQGPNLFLSGYFYAEDGRATWLVSNNAMPDPNSYDGRLLSFRDGQTLTGGYRKPSGPVDAGAIALRFTDDRHGTLTWGASTVAIERYGFQHGAAPALQPKTGWWWNPTQGGRGYSIELQGDHMFVGAYMYDTHGDPVWYVADALMANATTFRAPLLQFANGQTMTGPYKAPGTPTVVGDIVIEFTFSDQAVLTLSDRNGGSKAMIVLPQYLPPPPTPPGAPIAWLGNMASKSVTTVGDIVTTIDFQAPYVLWVRIDDTVDSDPLHYPAYYRLTGVGAFIYKRTSPGCEAHGGNAQFLTDGDLVVNASGAYAGSLSRISAAFTATEVCTTASGQTSRDFDVTVPLAFDFSGNVNGLLIKGNLKDPGTPNTVVTGVWDFTSKLDDR